MTPAACCCGERVAADEGGGLVHLHRVAQSRLPRRLVGRQLRAPRAATGFDAQRVDRVVAGILQAEFGAVLPQRVVERHALVGGHVELVARAADVAHPRRADARVADVDHPRRRRTACRPSRDRRARSRPSSASALGPITESTENALVTSTSAACSSARMARSIHAKSRVVCAEPVMMKNSSAPSRTMVRSLSKPPRALSIAV